MRIVPRALVPALILASVRCLPAQPQPGIVLWTYDTGSWVLSSPALGSDGTLYVGTTAGLCAITNNGSTASNRWTFSAALSSASPSASPAVASDGTIYSGSRDGKLYAINPDGSQKWCYPAAGGGGCPAIAYDNTIYSAAEGTLYAITPAGDLKWTSPGGDNGDSPSIGLDGTIYIVSYDIVNRGALYAIGPDGTRKWARPVQGPASDSPAIAADASIYVGAGLLYAFSPAGAQLWYTPTNNFTGYSPAVARSGMIYIRDYNDRYLNALGPSGQIIWRALQDIGAHTLPTVPAVDVTGTIFYCFSNSVAAISSQGQVLWTVYGGYTGAGIYLANTSPVLAPDGTIYAALGSTIYAIYNTNKLADSPWPMYRQNARHTGKIEKPLLQQPKKRADANFQFQLYAQLGGTDTVLTSTDLSTWSALTDVVVTNLPMDVVDLGASNFPRRFYRVVTK